MSRLKEEIIESLISNTWTDWNESSGILKISDENDQTDSEIILFNDIVEDESENSSQTEVKIIIEEIDNGSEKQLHYVILVDLNTKYIGSQDWKVKIVTEEEKYLPKFKITENQIDRMTSSSENGLLIKTVKRKIDGRIYCIESTNEGAAETIYTQYAYFTLKNGNLITVSCVIRYPQCMNYSEPYNSECANEHEPFNLDKIISLIVKNLRIEKTEEKIL